MSAKPSIIDPSASPEVTPEAARCQHRTLKGRCRQMATDPAKTLCFDHARAAIQAAVQLRDDFAPLPSLVRKPRHFRSPQALNKTLGDLHNLLAEGKISPRRAAVIAYIDSLILRTVVATHAEEKREPRTIIFDAPRPECDLPTDAPASTEPVSP